MRTIIKIIIKILIVLAILFLVVYFVQALKAHSVKIVRMQFAFQEGRISEKEYNQFRENHKFINTFLNPTFVFSVDSCILNFISRDIPKNYSDLGN